MCQDKIQFIKDYLQKSGLPIYQYNFEEMKSIVANIPDSNLTWTLQDNIMLRQSRKLGER